MERRVQQIFNKLWPLGAPLLARPLLWKVDHLSGRPLSSVRSIALDSLISSLATIETLKEKCQGCSPISSKCPLAMAMKRVSISTPSSIAARCRWQVVKSTRQLPICSRIARVVTTWGPRILIIGYLWGKDRSLRARMRSSSSWYKFKVKRLAVRREEPSNNVQKFPLRSSTVGSLTKPSFKAIPPPPDSLLVPTMLIKIRLPRIWLITAFLHQRPIIWLQANSHPSLKFPIPSLPLVSPQKSRALRHWHLVIARHKPLMASSCTRRLEIWQ